MRGEKSVRPVSGTCARSGAPLSGYEIHMGATTGPDTARPFAHLAHGPDGATSADGRAGRLLRPRALRRRCLPRPLARRRARRNGLAVRLRVGGGARARRSRRRARSGARRRCHACRRRTLIAGAGGRGGASGRLRRASPPPIRRPVLRTPLAVADAGSVRAEELIATDQVFPDRVGEVYRLAHGPGPALVLGAADAATRRCSSRLGQPGRRPRPLHLRTGRSGWKARARTRTPRRARASRSGHTSCSKAEHAGPRHPLASCAIKPRRARSPCAHPAGSGLGNAPAGACRRPSVPGAWRRAARDYQRRRMRSFTPIPRRQRTSRSACSTYQRRRVRNVIPTGEEAPPLPSPLPIDRHAHVQRIPATVARLQRHPYRGRLLASASLRSTSP